MNDSCLTCKDSGTVEGSFCTCRVGRALEEASKKVAEKKDPEFKTLGDDEDLDYFKAFADRASRRAFGKSFEEHLEEKTKELLEAMRLGKVTTRQVFHEKDRKKLASRFALYDSDDFAPVLVTADQFRIYYPRYEGTGKVRAFRLNPQKYGPPGPEVEPQKLDLFSQPTKPKKREKQS